MKKPAVGVIGVGSFGRHHARVYKELERCNLVGIFDEDSGRASQIAAATDTKTFPSADALLEQVDAVSIVTPTVTHAEIAMDALRKGIHVLIEKPIASDARDAERIVEAASASGVKVAVGHIERFNPAFRASINMIDDIRSFHSERLVPWEGRCLDVDVILDLMIHDLDLLVFLDPSDVKDIRATGAVVRSDKLDVTNAVIILESGTVAILDASRVDVRKYRSVQVHSGKKRILIDLLNKNATMSESDMADAATEIAWAEIEVTEYEPLREELIAFLDLISGIESPIATGVDALRSLRIAELISDSILKRR